MYIYVDIYITVLNQTTKPVTVLRLCFQLLFGNPCCKYLITSSFSPKSIYIRLFHYERKVLIFKFYMANVSINSDFSGVL